MAFEAQQMQYRPCIPSLLAGLLIEQVSSNLRGSAVGAHLAALQQQIGIHRGGAVKATQA